MRIGSLFSGAGGLDMAVEAVFGGETVWHCELDKAASKVLGHRWPGVPNLGDITAVDWTQVEPVDILCGGWPCQPWSIAGSKKGVEDERALWPYLAGAVRILRPSVVVLENVPNIIVLGELARAVGDLDQAGYDTQWACLRASDVGAPHQRERVFILATDTDHARRSQQWQTIAASQELPPAQYSGYFVDNLTLLSTPQARDSKGIPRDDYNQACLPRDIVDVEASWGKYEEAIRRWESLTRTVPAPTIPGVAGLKRPRLNPALSEWLMGWPAGWVTEVPGLSRNDQLRIIGNGVVPQCAAAALRYLLRVSEVAA